jgi:DNA-binding PadR family transcriptional regulator
MYGLELLNHLALIGYKVKENQLYPTLYRLESVGLLDQTRLKQVKGKQRKYFKSTETGKKLVIQYLINFLGLFYSLVTEKIDFVYDEINDLIGDIKSGMIIADFSERSYEEHFLPIAQAGQTVAPIGRVFMMNLGMHKEITEERIKSHGVEKTVSLLEIENGKTPLPDNNVDLVISAFTIHKIDKQWIIPEMARVLKPGCYGVIASFLDSDEVDVRFAYVYLLMDFMNEISPFEVRFGVNPEEIESTLIEHGLTIVNQKQGNGAIYYKVQKKKNTY